MKKKLVLLFILTGSFNVFAADTCRPAALKAAEENYPNNPDKTQVRTISLGKEYHVAVGIGNPEDGTMIFDVIFPKGCASLPTVKEISKF